MIWQLDLILLLFVFICAIASIAVKDLLSSAIIFGAYSFFMCLLWTEMGAVDVAFTEVGAAAGGSGAGLRLERERHYRGGEADWGAGLFYHQFLGRLPVRLQMSDILLVHGSPLGVRAVGSRSSDTSRV